MKRERSLISKEEASKRILSDNSGAMIATRGIARAIQKVPPHPEYSGTKPLVLIVGGYVRDTLLGLHPKDVDLQVYGLTPYDLEILLQHLFPDKIKIVGKAYEIIKVELDSEEELDVSMARGGPSLGKEAFSFGDPKCSPEIAALERDFSFNSVAADPLSGEIFDWHGGIKDLASCVSRITDQSIFRSSPVRVYRGLQFASRLSCLPDESSLFLMREMIHTGKLQGLHPKVLREEWYKLLVKGKAPSLGLSLAIELGLFNKEYPEISHYIQKVEQQTPRLCKTLDSISLKKSLLLIEENKRLAFILAIIILHLSASKEDHTIKNIFLESLKKIAIPQNQMSGIFGLLDRSIDYHSFQKEILQLREEESKLLNKNITTKKKIPGIRMTPILKNIELHEIQEKIRVKEELFTESIYPFYRNEFLVFWDYLSNLS